MKYLYVFGALAVVGGGVYFFMNSQSMKDSAEATIVPPGYHLMQDGTLMKNVDTMETPVSSDSVPATTPSLVTASSAPQQTVTLDLNARVFEVRGVNYGYDVKEIKVKEGDTITINFESTDGFHDLMIDEFAVATKRVQPGTKTSITFKADKKGIFEYYCSVGQHRANGQVGKLIVE